MKLAADIDPGLLRFLTTPLKLPANLGAWEQLATIGKEWVRNLLRSAATDGVLPRQVDLVQVIHIRPDHVDFGSPTIVRNKHHQRLLTADIVQALCVKESKGSESFFKRAAIENTPNGQIALLSKAKAKLDFAKLNARWIEIVLKNPASFDEASLELPPDKTIEDEWLLIPNFADILIKNEALIGSQMTRLATLVPSYTKRNGNGDETQSAEILYGENYLRHLSPLVSCGNVLLCAPTVCLPENNNEGRPLIGGGGCMFVLNEVPDVALIRRLSLFAHKIIAAIWTYQDLVRMASETSRASGAEDAFQMIVHSFGNAVNYVPPEAPQATRILLVENHMIRASRLLFTRSMPGPRDWLKREDGWIELLPAASCKEGERLEFDPGPLSTWEKIDSRLFALLLELGRNCVKHSSENPKRGSLTVRNGSRADSLHIQTENSCDYCCPRDLWDKFSKPSKSVTREKGLDFILWLAQSLARESGNVSFEISDPTHESDFDFERITSSFEGMAVECRVARRLLEELPNLQRDEDSRKKFRARCVVEINNAQPR